MNCKNNYPSKLNLLNDFAAQVPTYFSYTGSKGYLATHY